MLWKNTYNQLYFKHFQKYFNTIKQMLLTNEKNGFPPMINEEIYLYITIPCYLIIGKLLGYKKVLKSVPVLLC